MFLEVVHGSFSLRLKFHFVIDDALFLTDASLQLRGELLNEFASVLLYLATQTVKLDDIRMFCGLMLFKLFDIPEDFVIAEFASSLPFVYLLGRVLGHYKSLLEYVAHRRCVLGTLLS